MKKLILCTITLLLVLLTLYACSDEQEENKTYIVSSDASIRIVQDIGYVKTKWSPSGKKLSVIEMDERIYNSRIISID